MPGNACKNILLTFTSDQNSNFTISAYMYVLKDIRTIRGQGCGNGCLCRAVNVSGCL